MGGWFERFPNVTFSLSRSGGIRQIKMPSGLTVGPVWCGMERVLWADTVFHVLAHVGAHREIPAGLFEPRYVGFAAGVLGPASERALGEDATWIGQLFPTHEVLAAAQLLAWLYADAETAEEQAARSWSELSASEVAWPEAYARLSELGDRIDFLRGACLLELDGVRQLVSPAPPDPTLFRQLTQVAPDLARLGIRHSLPLWNRGRLCRGDIWLGFPRDAPGWPSAAEVGWQAAHEATVNEVARRSELSERGVEHVALVLLHQRAVASGLESQHATWFRTVGKAPAPGRSWLNAEQRRVLDTIVQSPGRDVE